MQQILRTRRSRADLLEIILYIRENNPSAAKRFLDQVDSRLKLLAKFPLIGSARSELGENLRSLPVGKHLIFYRPTEKGIRVVRILHGARNLSRIFRRR